MFDVSDAIRNHILQWANEKNRKLTDGYDFEVQLLVRNTSSLLLQHPIQLAFWEWNIKHFIPFFLQKSRTPAKRALSSQTTDSNENIGK